MGTIANRAHLFCESFMKIGDLVKMKPLDLDPMERTTGIILGLDLYNKETRIGRVNSEPIAEVLWESGPSWILLSRIEEVKKNR